MELVSQTCAFAAGVAVIDGPLSALSPRRIAAHLLLMGWSSCTWPNQQQSSLQVKFIAVLVCEAFLFLPQGLVFNTSMMKMCCLFSDCNLLRCFWLSLSLLRSKGNLTEQNEREKKDWQHIDRDGDQEKNDRGRKGNENLKPLLFFREVFRFS